jgi:hypothetical protein
MKIKIILLLSIVLFSWGLKAQEINCQVSVSARQVEGSEKEVFRTLQTAIYEFMNNRKWSPYSFKIEERIECTILINITERISTDEFKGTLNIVLRRPVFKTNYNSVMLNHVDRDFQFSYVEFEPLEFSETTFTSNLTSTLAFYTYIFLGLDFDSFQKFGGTPFYEKAQSIVNAAQNATESGWKAFEGTKNRYWLLENLTNSSYAPLREFLYKYHRQGLDMMFDNLETGRSNIAEALKLLERANQERPGLFLTQLILEAKRDEIISIFSEAGPMEKPEVVNILKEIDPANSSKYQKIMSGN